MKPKILIASIVNQEPAVLDAHLQLLKEQDADAQVDFFYCIDKSDPRWTSNVIVCDRYEVKVRAIDKPDAAAYSVREETHDWSVPTFHWLAQAKQGLIQHARAGGYDYLWLVDSDLLHAPSTLRSLLATRRPVVSPVFWTRWTPSDSPLPQVWLRHPYDLGGRGLESHEFLKRLDERRLVRVWGLGASTLIRKDVFDKFNYELLPDLPAEGMWQGEDRHACVRAERLHQELWADAWPDVWHCYRPSDYTAVESRVEMLKAPQPERPALGDLVSFTIEPCEEPGLASHVEPVRGRLGRLSLAEGLEEQLVKMRVGEDAFVRLYFPPWYDLAPYRGARKLVRVRLLDVRSYRPAPTLDDEYGRVLGEIL